MSKTTKPKATRRRAKPKLAPIPSVWGDLSILYRIGGTSYTEDPADRWRPL
ncbi:hypothetical protein [Variovorax sp. PBL-E5]|uniref:hypothetical protein n=1 Tax=Variovorax sp. PBL-E5 TaxID=434014 RepID=UPI001315FC6D|nr:hypothetical protein [Variovorax sp. PBL-E5]VTU29971.1 hypothetical protein E5CHR_02919 [Variovorax sp. PBL-E5]